MSKRLKQKIESSKLYAPNWLSLTHNNDLSHEKLWNQKVEEGKHIQEQKQIDRILFGIVKERLFGQLLSQDTRISNQGYYALDRLNKELVNPTVVKGSRRIMPLSSQPAYDIVARSRLKHRTLDAGDSRATRSFHRRSNNQSSQLRMSKLPSQQNPLSKTKRFFFPKQISASKLPNLAAHFRELTNSPTTMLYDIKLSKEMLIKYNKSKEIVSPFCLDKLLYFFNFTGPYNIKLYGTWVESVFNCTMGESSFAIFQVLDQSRNGFLTVTDIFQALQDFPMSSSSQVEKQIYDLMQRIKQTREPQSPQPKLSVQQIIVRNHTLKLQQMRDLVKESSKELISTDTFKSTTYHKSMYALEHTAASREKNSQLEYSQGNSSKGFERVKKRAPVREEGLRFGDYANIFSARRSEFFLLFARLLLGEDASVLLQ